MHARPWPFRRWTVCALLAAATAARADHPAPDPSTPVVDDYRITILSDAIPGRKTIGEWGFAALVEVTAGGATRRILFDTGDKPGTVLSNAATLGIDLCTVEDVVLSHHHADHTGGLLNLRNTCVARGHPEALRTAWAGGQEILWSRLGADGLEKNPLLSSGAAQSYIASGGTIDVGTGGPRQLLVPGVYLTGHVPRAYDERTYLPVTPMQMWNPELGRYVEELVPEDQALVINTASATVVLTGCAHSGAVNTLLAARSIVGGEPYLVLAGGLHWYQMERGDKHQVSTVDWEADTMQQLNVTAMLGGHCTGFERFFYIRDYLKYDASQAAMAAVGTVLAREPRFTFTLPQAFNIPMLGGHP